MAAPPVIFITGRDPQKYVDSHCVYVRTHGYAAVRAGYDVHLMCLDEHDRSEETPYGTIHAIRTRVHMVRQNQIPFHSRFLTGALNNLVKKLGAGTTILHGFGLWGYPAVRASKQQNNTGMRCISIMGSYTTYLDESLSQWRGLLLNAGIRLHAIYAFEQAWIRAAISHYERFAYRNADRILVNYRSVERMIYSRFGSDLRCTLITYTAEKEFEPVSRVRSDVLCRNSVPVIVSIAQHMPRKGVDVLLRALQIVKASNLSFSAHIIGGGPLFERHRNMLEALQLSDCVVVHGIVPSVDQYLDKADIFVLPSREEQSGSLALIEAMRAGVASIASGCDGIPEDVNHLFDAWLTTPGDHRSLAVAIVALLRDPSLRDKIARRGRQTFERRFSAIAFSRKLDCVYRDALKQSQEPPV